MSEQSAAPATSPTLIVDDDVNFCAALRSAFRRRGINALIAHNYEDAIAEAAAWRPNRAVVDLRMPGKNGLETIKTLREQDPNLQIVVLTGYANIETAVAAIRLGAANYLTKPAEVDDILAAFDQRPTDSLSIDKPVQSLREVETAHMLSVLEQTGGNISETARRLGINRRTLQRRLARVGGENDDDG